MLCLLASIKGKSVDVIIYSLDDFNGMQFKQCFIINMQLQKPEVSTIEDDTKLRLQCRNKPQILNMNDVYRTGVGSECGYCHKSDGSFTWSFTKKKVEPYTYQLMMERGWRRCGTYYYKPDLIKSCCKSFTHRLQVPSFRIKRDQRKALKRVIAVAYEVVQKIENEQKEKQQKKELKKQQKLVAKSTEKNDKKKQQVSAQMVNKLRAICNGLTVFLQTEMNNILTKILSPQSIAQFQYDLQGKIKFFKSKPGQKSNYYSNYVMLIFGLNKKHFSDKKYSLLDFNKDVTGAIQSYKVNEAIQLQVQRGGYLLFKLEKQSTNQFQILQQPCQKVEAIKSQGNHEQKGIVMSFLQTIKNKIKGQDKKSEQIADVKNDLPHKKTSNSFQVLKPHLQYKGEINIKSNQITFGKITINIVPAQESQESFRLYQKYCTKIHEKKQKSMSSYINFLCLQAINYKEQIFAGSRGIKYIPSWDPTEKHQKGKSVQGQVKKLMGCYHMKYYLQNKLIAVGVIDIVNHGLSSVYFFYDPEYKELRLGVFSSLIQIEYLRWLGLTFPQFRYYYMGFYISNCQKMNYKVDYSPCELLCPLTYRFVPFNEQIRNQTDKIALGQEKDLKLSGQSVEMNQDMKFGKDIGPYIDKNINIIYENKRLVLKQINPHFYIHILKILNTNLPVWGKKLFQIFAIAL